MIPYDIPSAVSILEAERLMALARGKVVLELGADKGFSTIVMASEAAIVFSVDWHRGDEHTGVQDTLNTYMNNLTRYGVDAKVVPIVGRFEDVHKILCHQKFEMIFLDGAHDHDSVMRDINHFHSALSDLGVFAFHDWDRFEVNEPVMEYVDKSGRYLEVVDHLAIAHPVLP